MTSVEEKIETGKALKNEGNEAFKAQDDKLALAKYHRALLYLKGLDQSDLAKSVKSLMGGGNDAETVAEQKKTEIRETIASIYNNISAVHTRANANEKALKFADECLKLQPENIKALNRKANALMNLNQLGQALDTFKRMLQIDPACAGAKNGVAKIKGKERAAQTKSDQELRGFLAKGL